VTPLHAKARTAGILAVSAVLALAGCTPAPAPEPQASDTLAPFAIDQDFPDPDVLQADGEYIAFATNTGAVNVQAGTSDDLAEWNVSPDDALPQLPAWASRGRTWAPDVSALATGGYIMYFVAQDSGSNKQCIGVAVAADATGPFAPVEGDPLVCPLSEGGAIDPATFTDDDGTKYLVWKTDGNCCALDTWIELAPLTADGTQLAGAPTKLFKQTEAWEGNLVEAPDLVKHGSKYYIFYSANDYASENYAIGVASASAITGPYTKESSPVLSTDSSGGRYLGPGGEDVVSTPKGDVLFFHGWNDLMMYRGMYDVPLEWKGDKPSVKLP
jgi:arabinan endo-1,5-alpha-L-arabinosidase